jgi:hypothetical protein
MHFVAWQIGRQEISGRIVKQIRQEWQTLLAKNQPSMISHRLPFKSSSLITPSRQDPGHCQQRLQDESRS